MMIYPHYLLVYSTHPTFYSPIWNPWGPSGPFVVFFDLKPPRGLNFIAALLLVVFQNEDGWQGGNGQSRPLNTFKPFGGCTNLYLFGGFYE
jgi:hypothetical protein